MMVVNRNGDLFAPRLTASSRYVCARPIRVYFIDLYGHTHTRARKQRVITNSALSSFS